MLGQFHFTTVKCLKTILYIFRPDTASYIQKLEREREAREKGELKDNRSFLAKYVSSFYIISINLFIHQLQSWGCSPTVIVFCNIKNCGKNLLIDYVPSDRAIRTFFRKFLLVSLLGTQLLVTTENYLILSLMQSRVPNCCRLLLRVPCFSV